LSELLSKIESRKLPDPDERIRLRKAFQLSQREVAEELGVTVITLRAWETGRTHPRSAKREQYARLLRRLRQLEQEGQAS